MKLARVIGTAVATIHHPGFDGHKLMLVRPEGPDGKPTGTGYLAVDQIAAGPGDRVLVLSEGSGVRQLLGGNPPIRSVIVGIVDDVYREI